MGSENEADQSKGRSCRGRTWRTYDLTSSIVPRGTSSHHVVELVFLPIAVGCLLSCGYGLLPDPAELGAINPNAVHDHGQLARQRHNRFLQPRRLAICIAQLFSQDHFVARISSIWAAS